MMKLGLKVHLYFRREGFSKLESPIVIWMYQLFRNNFILVFTKVSLNGEVTMKFKDYFTLYSSSDLK